MVLSYVIFLALSFFGFFHIETGAPAQHTLIPAYVILLVFYLVQFVGFNYGLYAIRKQLTSIFCFKLPDDLNYN